jgi:membrane protein DedA with SNARE-associated domain
MWWEYVLLFIAVAIARAGVPFVGATALAAAGAAASQGKLNLLVVVVVGTAAGEVGGLIGYAVGHRWGHQLLERFGKHGGRRQRMVERGEVRYAKLGPSAVFFTPAIVAGTIKMNYRQFVLWNLLESFGFSVSVAAGAYGLGELLSGHRSPW